MKNALLKMYILADGKGDGVPNPTRHAPGELEDSVNRVLGIAAWAGTAAAVAGILVTAIKMAVAMKNGGQNSEHMSHLGMVLGGCILVATAGPLVSFVFNA